MLSTGDFLHLLKGPEVSLEKSLEMRLPSGGAASP